MEEDIYKRIFIALNLPENIREEIQGISNKLAQKYEGIKWTDKECYHITLHFLGNLNLDKTDQVKMALQSLAGRFSDLEFVLENIGAFPGLTRARIIFLACRQTNGNFIIKLQQLIGEKMIALNINVDERSWQPHITLGRVKYGTMNIPVNLAVKTKSNFVVSSFDLMESRLEPSGPIYSLIAKFNLAKSRTANNSHGN